MRTCDGGESAPAARARHEFAFQLCAPRQRGAPAPPWPRVRTSWSPRARHRLVRFPVSIWLRSARHMHELMPRAMEPKMTRIGKGARRPGAPLGSASVPGTLMVMWLNICRSGAARRVAPRSPARPTRPRVCRVCARARRVRTRTRAQCDSHRHRAQYGGSDAGFASKDARFGPSRSCWLCGSCARARREPGGFGGAGSSCSAGAPVSTEGLGPAAAASAGGSLGVAAWVHLGKCVVARACVGGGCCQ